MPAEIGKMAKPGCVFVHVSVCIMCVCKLGCVNGRESKALTASLCGFSVQNT